MISTEKPGTPEELVHFGVKGMKWGVHRTAGSRAFKESNPKNADRRHEIKRARASVKATKTAYKAEKDPGKKQMLKDTHLSNPDKATALRLKRGEKVAALLLAGPLSASLVVPTAVGAVVGARVGKRRAIEA